MIQQTCLLNHTDFYIACAKFVMHMAIFSFKFTEMNKLQKFSSELEVPCPSVKLFHLDYV